MAKIRDWWEARFLGLEFGVAVLLTAVFVAWYYTRAGTYQITAFLTNRGDVYGALAGVSGALLGFVITAVSIVLGYAEHERLKTLVLSHSNHTLWDVFRSTVKSLAAATIAALLALIFDRQGSPMPLLLFLVLFTSLLAALRVARSIWVFEYIIRIVTTKPPLPASPPVFPAPAMDASSKKARPHSENKRRPVRRKTAA